MIDRRPDFQSIVGTFIHPRMQLGDEPKKLQEAARKLRKGRLLRGIYIQASGSSGLIKYSALQDKFVRPISTMLGITGNRREAKIWVKNANRDIGRR